MTQFKSTIDKMNILFEVDLQSLYKSLIEMVDSFGGEIYLVGGAVRDKLMGNNNPKDYDFMVTNIRLEDLGKMLLKFIPSGKINEVGKSFGIIKFIFNGDEYDFSIPRGYVAGTTRANDTSNYDKDLDVKSDLQRRDFVINAGAWNIKTEFNESNIISPDGYNVVKDIKNKLIRAVGDPNKRFFEDPLRILRGIQFASRFGFIIEENTLQSIKENIDSLKSVSSERFYEEFFKGWTKGNADTDKFFKLLIDTNIGMLMFGKDFQPIALDKKDVPAKDFFLAQYIAAFLNGGDFTMMNKKVDEQDYVRVARWFNNAIKKGIDVSTIREITKHGDKFEFIKNVFGMIDSKTRGVKRMFMDKIISNPLIPRQDSNKPRQSWELPITGEDIMEISKQIGKPLMGKAVGETVNNLIKLYQSGEITASDDDNINKQTIEAVLRDKLLKESYVEDANRLEIIKKRINNIYYK